MQLPRPDDFIIATGVTHSVKEWLDTAFEMVELKADDYVQIDQTLLRPSSNTVLVGDASKAKHTFGFEPKVKFKDLVKLMVEEDLKQCCLENKKTHSGGRV